VGATEVYIAPGRTQSTERGVGISETDVIAGLYLGHGLNRTLRIETNPGSANFQFAGINWWMRSRHMGQLPSLQSMIVDIRPYNQRWF
jgi:hypothetical protein